MTSKSTKSTKSKKGSSKKTRQDTPVVVFIWIMGLGLLGYLVGRIALDAFPHPIHWASGVLGAIIGYFVGWLWYRWRGDVI